METIMERWDVYDEKKQLTGRTKERNDWSYRAGEYHLSVLAVICRPDGKFLITRRTMEKEWAPGWWEVSGGAAKAGETSGEAVLREVREETGLDVSCASGGFLFSYHRENPKECDNYFVDVYKYTLDFQESDIKVQPEEVAGYRIATRQEIEEYGRRGIFLHFDSIRRAFFEE
jgi:8-oxo-dGTP pyrophosphatase MutT (NUDIX family)